MREWWGDLHLSLTGVAGIWNDMNEPAINDRPFGDGERFGFPQRPGEAAGGHLPAPEVHVWAEDGSSELRRVERPYRTLIRADKIRLRRCAALVICVDGR